MVFILLLPATQVAHVTNPTYEQVKEGNSGHYEAVEIVFDQVKFLMNLFWTSTGNKLIRRTQVVSFMIADHNIGQQYFTRTSNKNDWRNNRNEELEQSGRFKQPIVTEILKASTFYPAEEEHPRLL